MCIHITALEDVIGLYCKYINFMTFGLLLYTAAQIASESPRIWTHRLCIYIKSPNFVPADKYHSYYLNQYIKFHDHVRPHNNQRHRRLMAFGAPTSGLGALESSL